MFSKLEISELHELSKFRCLQSSSVNGEGNSTYVAGLA